MFDNKGQIRIIEAFLAVSIMFSVLSLTLPLSPTPNYEKQGTLKKMGTQVLLELDKNGTLGKLIEDGNWTILERSVEILLPLGVFFNVTVYDERMQEVSTQHIDNSDLGKLLDDCAISVQYLCATRESAVRFYIVRLQLGWAK